MKHESKKFKTTPVRGGASYVEVKERLKYLAFDFDGEYSIETDYTYFAERKMWVVKAKLTLVQGDVTSVYTGLAQEVEVDDYKKVNSTSALENAETSAVGRACGMAGIGVNESIASADEVNKAVNRGSRMNRSESQDSGEAATEKQKQAIRTLSQDPVITGKERANVLNSLDSITLKQASERIKKMKETIEERRAKQP